MTGAVGSTAGAVTRTVATRGAVGLAAAGGVGYLATREEQPTVLRWQGEEAGWWRRNGWTVGAGAIAAGGIGLTGLMTASGGYAASGGPTGMAFAGAALAGGLAVAGITHLVRRGSDKVPELPASVAVPTLPAAAAVPDVHGGEAMYGTQAAHGSGSYWENVPVTRYRTNYEGELESYTDFELQLRYFSWDLQLEEQVGRREGYGSVDEALRDITAGDSVALRRQDGRIVAYDMQRRDHWGDLDRLTVTDPATEAIVSPGGAIWRRTEAGQSRMGRGWRDNVDRPDPTGVHGRKIGRHELRYQGDAVVSAGVVRSGQQGHAQLATALGELRARPGDQVVVERFGRYHVADADRSRHLDRSMNNDGFVVDDAARGAVVAVEQEGGLWSPVGDWYVAPKVAG